MIAVKGLKTLAERIGPNWLFVGGVALIVALALSVAYCGGKKAGKDDVLLDDAKAEVAFERAVGNAVGSAAEDRANETILIDETESEAHDAIAKAPETAPAPAAVALGCERLRRAGKDVSRYPSCR